MALGLERRVPDQELEAKDPECPQVNLLVVVLPFDHLRRQVVEGPAQRGPLGRGRVDAPPEVGDLQVLSDVEQQVLGLDVAVDHLSWRITRFSNDRLLINHGLTEPLKL